MKKQILFILILTGIATQGSAQLPYKYSYGISTFSWMSHYSSYTGENFLSSLKNSSVIKVAPGNTGYGYSTWAFGPTMLLQFGKCLAYKPGRYFRSMTACAGFVFKNESTFSRGVFKYQSHEEYGDTSVNFTENRPELLLSYGREIKTDRKECNYYAGFGIVLQQSFRPMGHANVVVSGHNSSQGYYRESESYESLKMKASTAVYLQITLGFELILTNMLTLKTDMRPGLGYQFTHDGPTLKRFQLPIGIGIHYFTGMKK